MNSNYDAIVVVHPLYAETGAFSEVDLSFFDGLQIPPNLYDSDMIRTFSDPKYGEFKKNLKNLLVEKGDTPAILYEQETKFHKTWFLLESDLIDRMIPTNNKGYATFPGNDVEYMKKYKTVLLTGQIRGICIECAEKQLNEMGIKVIKDDKYIYDGWWNNPDVVKKVSAGDIL